MRDFIAEWSSQVVLAGLITRRSEVQILLPLLCRCVGSSHCVGCTPAPSTTIHTACELYECSTCFIRRRFTGCKSLTRQQDRMSFGTTFPNIYVSASFGRSALALSSSLVRTRVSRTRNLGANPSRVILFRSRVAEAAARALLMRSRQGAGRELKPLPIQKLAGVAQQ